MSATDDDIAARSKKYRPKVKAKHKKYRRLKYKVKGDTGTYTVIVQSESGDFDSDDVKVSCDCPAFLYWGSDYDASVLGYLYGQSRAKGRAPDERDPDTNNLVCKHAYAALQRAKRVNLQKQS